MSEPSPSFFKRLVARIVPKAPDFHALLNEQVAGVLAGAELLVEFMETNAAEVGARVLEQEHKSDDIKVLNLQILSEAFSTPIDREDIYRAIVGLDEVAKFCTAARKSERAVERTYRQALAELFQGSDYINMFKRREIYRHLSNTADRVAACAATLNDIAVKMG